MSSEHEVRIPGERSLSNGDAAIESGHVDVDEAALDELLSPAGETPRAACPMRLPHG